MVDKKYFQLNNQIRVHKRYIPLDDKKKID